MLIKNRCTTTHLLFVIVGMILTACGDQEIVVEIPAGTPLKKVINIDIYAPFERTILLNDPETEYGQPKNGGSKSKGNHYVFFDEYVGKHGRIRIYNEAYQSERGWESNEWLEVFTGGLYLDDVIHHEYIKEIEIKEGRWKLYFRPQNRSWYLTLELEGKAVTKIIDH